MPLVFPIPPLSTGGANVVAFFFASSYVLSLYLSKRSRIWDSPKANGPNANASQNKTRDDPSVIKARMLAASTSTILSCIVVFLLVWHIVDDLDNNASLAFDSTMARLGLTLFEDHSLLPYLVTPILYLGPLYVRFLGSKLPFQSMWSWDQDVLPAFNTWVGVRNYFFGPITEELVFRACVLAVYHLAGSSRKKMIFLSPLLFGLAHLHHAWEMYTNGGKTVAAAKRALLITLIQLAYTTLFGFHCAFLFLRTGSIYPPLFSHMFCNFMGLPQIGYELQLFPHRRAGIVFVYLLGIVGYIFAMGNWTLDGDSLYWQDRLKRY